MSAVAMKDSGVDWLGEIPAHWDVKPLKTAIKQVMNGAWGTEVNDLQYSLLPCIVLRGTDFPDAASGSLTNAPVRYIDKRDAARKTLQNGDIVVEISGGSETQATGRALHITEKLMSNANSPLLCTNFAKALRLSTDTVTPRFFSIYWFSLYALGRPFIYEKRTTGIRNFQYKDFVANEPILLPPLHEQRAIASYLDRETARIDRLINKTQALNALLREKRVALISQAVTKGLDAGAEMKESGVEWLGEIPVHWDVKRLKHIATVRTTHIDPTLDKFSQYKLVAPNHIESSTGRMLEVDSAQEQGAISAKVPFQQGDVLYSKIRPNLHKVCIAPFDGICSSDIYPLVPNKNSVSSYFLYTILTKGFHQLTVLQVMGATIPRISQESLMDIQIPLPPLHEQRAIASYLDRETARIDALINKNDELIALLREKRSALISAAVTGKISVDLTPPPGPLPEASGRGSTTRQNRISFPQCIGGTEGV